MLMSRRQAVRLLSGLSWTAFCGCRSVPPMRGEYANIRPARFVHFSHRFNTCVGAEGCAVTVRPMGAGLVRLDFSTLGLALRDGNAFGSQMLAGNLQLQLQSPVKLLGFINTLHIQVHKPKGCRVLVCATLAGCHDKLDLGCKQDIRQRPLVRHSQSMMSWAGSPPGWQDPPPYSLALELQVTRLPGMEYPGVIVESLEIQAVEA